MQNIHTLIHRLHNPDAGIFLLRLALAAVFVTHGWEKVSNIDQFIGFFSQIGIGAFLTYVWAYTEFLGGIALFLGIFVRYAGMLLAFGMAVAIFAVHWPNGYSLANGGYEYVLTLFLGTLAIVTLGSGKYSLARMWQKGQ